MRAKGFTRPKENQPCRQPTARQQRQRQGRERHRKLASRLGPGLITGAADDDPSGIATYSQAGAQFRFGLSGRWS